jgi:hypothetical protein
LTAGYGESSYTVEDDASLGSDSYAFSTNSKMVSLFESRGKADCMIIAGGKVFLCHRALLAQRSPELRDMILLETPSDNDLATPTQILLPELQKDTARALLHYLYTDMVPNWAINSTSLLSSLARAAKMLRVPRLQVMCEQFLSTLYFPGGERGAGGGSGSGATEADGDQQPQQSASVEMEMPPSTLGRDMGSLVGDPEFADVRFIAEGKPIVAHRFVLENSCEYFRVMFRSGMAESQFGGAYGGHHSYAAHNAAAHRMTDVIVPDTFVGFLRLLLFVYTGRLPDGSDGALLEDIMAADR